MKEYHIKSFLTHASGKNVYTCADKIAINEEKRRYAVADGVSASHMPPVWAEILVNSFVNEDVSPVLYAKHLEEGALRNMSVEWYEQTERIASCADDKLAMRYARTKELYGNAASTLVGISIDNDIVDFFIVGDSCLFLVDDSNITVLSEIKSSDSFTNRPDYLSSDNHIEGTPVVGSETILNGWIVLMTDAVAKWFWKSQEKNPGTIDELWNIPDQEKFDYYIQQLRDAGLMENDDVAVIMIKVDNNNEVLQETMLEPVIPSSVDEPSFFLSWLSSCRIIKKIITWYNKKQ